MPATLELLAPARNAEIGIEAVKHGADAVYIGGPEFGARHGAGNSVADIERLAAYAHRFHAKLFITLNTIFRDEEIEDARRLAWQMYEAGADALIVQDMGLLELDLPPIQLHASTQTDIRTPEKARFLQDVGFSQMVLARELTRSQIEAIAAEVQQATLEFFVHGALCVAYSGQCFISHAVTGRSANRGSCSQECRQPYTVTDAEGRIHAHDKHVLSLKDNDQSANLAALVDAGIRSFKIEGRYKDMGTVKNVTAHYRQLLDALLEQRPELARASSGRCRYTFTPDPARDYLHHGDVTDLAFIDGADGQRYVAGPGPQRLHSQVECRRAGSTGVFDAKHRNAFDAEAAHGDRPGNRGLPLEQAIGQRCIECRADVGGLCAGVFQSQGDGLADHHRHRVFHDVLRAVAVAVAVNACRFLNVRLVRELRTVTFNPPGVVRNKLQNTVNACAGFEHVNDGHAAHAASHLAAASGVTSKTAVTLRTSRSARALILLVFVGPVSASSIRPRVVPQ